MQMKTIIRYDLTMVITAIIKKKKKTNPQTINVGEGVEKREPFYTAGGSVNTYNYYGKQYGKSLKN